MGTRVCPFSFTFFTEETIMRKTVQIQIASLLVGAAIIGGVAMPTWAVDGVVLIDQNKAMAGNVTPGDTPGFPVTISLPGSYRLSGNLTVPDENTTAIDVTVGGVSIDLNGFGIFGPTICTGFPAVTNCAPTGTGYGIKAEQLNHADTISLETTSISNGTIKGMGAGGILCQSDSFAGCLIDGVRAVSNGRDGMFIGGGLYTRNVVIANGGYGIIVNAFVLAVHNSAFGNRQ